MAQGPLSIGSMPPSEAFDSARHRQEKAHLMKRMDRKNGKWGTSHPRYRLLEALFGFNNYTERNMVELGRWRSLYNNVGKKQKRILERRVEYRKKLDDIEELIHTNGAICKSIVASAMQFYRIDQQELDDHMKQASQDGRLADKMSVTQTLKHFVRDWADEGVKERNEAFPCILSTLDMLKVELSEGKPLKVLLPGSGLGRLGHEVANLGGFEVTVNEWSMYMNIGYRHMETYRNRKFFAIHPFIDGMSHHATTDDMLREITAPNAPLNPGVLLVEGDFNTAFNGQEGHYDIIVTHFFIDTARNLMAYLDTIHRLLRRGGRWVNFGPLLYGTGPFVQLSLDEIIAVVDEMGFEFEDLADECGSLTFPEKKVRSKEAGYGFNKRALTRNAYLAQVWVAKKN
ncbi:N2227-domain-containing protein [Cucurbitaria berberidis CBS 394.84]|uniref:N2227-domain-containing protein n=1 Tax=Cucurbitaria berberidis CBS 394.84 TaxID=1168544 RepID=A0A9P4GRK6_9PLEO|nr:N2227-domain-containing protein [Cucurbitaria berberidis CBS 394.84]KAF1850096.1 N2227-domain-containing protein [Cucurbitaria berberidis CBS 394.84]